MVEFEELVSRLERLEQKMAEGGSYVEQEKRYQEGVQLIQLMNNMIQEYEEELEDQGTARPTKGTLEEKLAKVEKVHQILTSLDDLPIDKFVAYYKKGMRLATECQAELNGTS